MQLNLKTLLLRPMLLLISCGKDFDWEPRPWVGDSVSQSLINSQGEIIKTDEPRFDTMTCFDPSNIAELRSAIAQVEDKVVQKKIKEAVKEADTKVWYAREQRTNIRK